MTHLEIKHVGPLVSIQDKGRFGALKYGVASSGPMDREAYEQAGILLSERQKNAAQTVLEYAGGRLEFTVMGAEITAAFCGGLFSLKINGKPQEWASAYILSPRDVVEIAPGSQGNYALIRFDHEFDVPKLIGSRSTNTIANLGGYDGRMLRAGDKVKLLPATQKELGSQKLHPQNGPIRFIWGLHADLFSNTVRQAFIHQQFVISSALDRMGVRLVDKAGVFKQPQNLSLVSDAVVPGDVQILGDGTPIVLMRDHQPTGGYPRIGTIISADLSRFAQLRPGTEVQFTSVSVEHAHKLLKGEK